MRARAWVAVVGLFAIGFGVARYLRGRAAGPTPVEDPYAAASPPRFEVELGADAGSALRREPRERVAAHLVYSGQRTPVEVRIKGHRSRRGLDEKPALSLRVGSRAEPLELFGQHKLTFNNLVEDPSALREALAYRFFDQLGVLAPRTAHVALSIDGQAYGRYLLVENLDDDFLERRYGHRRGVLYEGEYGCDLFEGDVMGFDRDAGEDPDRERLHQLVRAAHGPAEQLFDPERGPLAFGPFLRYLAGSALLGDFDGYRHSHNYFLHFEPGLEKWQLLPWGLDRTFKRSLGIYDSQGWLAKRCFAHAACRLAYVVELSRAVEVFESLDLSREADEMIAVIDAAIEDVRAPHSKKQVDVARQRLKQFVAKRPAEVREQLGCIDGFGRELDRDGDGHGCMDCDDRDDRVHPGAVEVCDGVDNDCSGLVDDSPECPCHAIELPGGPHELCQLAMPFADAEAFCEKKGLSLVRIDSRETSKALSEAATRLELGRWWIGYSDREVEGRFAWRDGSVGEFSYWAKGEPDDGTCNQDCAALKEGGSGRWQDTHCNQHRPFICGPRRAQAGAGDSP